MYANPSLQRNMWTVVLCKVRLIGAIVSRETQHTRNMRMKSNCLFLLVLLFTIVNSPIPERGDGRKCVAGERFYDGCNWCHCAGGFVVCTMKACYDFETGGRHKPKKAPRNFWEKNKT